MESLSNFETPILPAKRGKPLHDSQDTAGVPRRFATRNDPFFGHPLSNQLTKEA